MLDFLNAMPNFNPKVQDRLCTAWGILSECIKNKVVISAEQYELLGQLCRDVRRYGNLEQKQKFCYILWWARGRSRYTDNFNLCIEIEKYFRKLCAPWFNTENSFKKINSDFLKELESGNSKTLSMQA